MTNSDTTGHHDAGTKEQNERHLTDTTKLRNLTAVLERLAGNISLEELTELETHGDNNDGQASLPPRNGIWSQVDLGKAVDEDASVSVVGRWSSREPPRVELHVAADAADVTLNISSDRSRELASDLLVAASHAEKKTNGG